MTRLRPSLFWATLAVAAALGAAGCGSTESLSASAAGVLQKDAATLAAAARAGDRTKADLALATLRGDVAEQRAAGQLSAARAGEILDAATRVAADAPMTSPTPAPTSSRATAARTPPAPTTTTTPTPTTTRPPATATRTVAAKPTPNGGPGHGASKKPGKHGKGPGKPHHR